MTIESVLQPPPRRIACSQCGMEFSCGLSTECWCAAETTKLPLPTANTDCLCPDCLRKPASAAIADAAR